MSLNNWDCASLFASSEVLAPVDLDNANTNMTAHSIAGYAPGSRFLALVTVLPNEVTDTGMNFKIQDAATSGGALADIAKSTVAASVAGTVSVARHVLELSFSPTPGRPFVKVVGTKVDTDSDVTVQAHILGFRQV
jgi:hypothetical protein